MENFEEKTTMIEKLNQDYIKERSKFCIISNVLAIVSLTIASALWVSLMYDVRIYAVFAILAELLMMMSSEIFEICIYRKYNKKLNSIPLNENEKENDLFMPEYLSELDNLLGKTYAVSILVVLCIISAAAIGYGVREQVLMSSICIHLPLE